MPFTFDRPVGAGADVSELEFVSALMQTNLNEMRVDGSLTATDISLYLSSRYGVKVSPEQVSDLLLQDFTSVPNSDGKSIEDEETKESKLDLVEFVSLLLIPHLCRDEKGDVGALLSSMLKDALGSSSDDDHDSEPSDGDKDIVLTLPLLQKAFLSLGESSIARQETLLKEMIEAVARFGGQRGEDVILNKETFAAALVHDLETYDPAFPQVYRAISNHTVNDGKSADDDEEALPETKAATRAIPMTPTASCIDLAADTFHSRLVVIFTWCFFGLSFLTYYSGIGTFLMLPQCQNFQFRATWAANLGPFFCNIGWSIVRWLYIVAVMSVYGLVYFGLVTVGNGVGRRNPALPTIGAIASAAFTVVPLFIPQFTRGDPEIDLFLKVITTTFGAVVVILNAWAALKEGYKRWITKTANPLDAYPKDPMMKEACLAKTEVMVTNALKMHESKDVNTAIKSRVGRAMLNFANYGYSEYETVGGFWWTWKQIWNKELFKTEGVWFSGRLVSINVTQFVLAIFILAAGLYITITFTDDYVPPLNPIEQLFNLVFDMNPGVQNIAKVISMVASTTSNFLVDSTPWESYGCQNGTNMNSCTLDNLQGCQADGQSWLCSVVDYTMAKGKNAAWEVQSALLDKAGYAMDDVYKNTNESLAEQAVNTVETLYPTEKYMIFYPFLFATIAAFITAMIVALAVVPSMATTALKLRSGVIDLMHDRQHRYFRKSPDNVAYLRGNMFWGTLFSAGLMGIVVGGLMFLFLWQNTASVAQQVVAAILGMLLVLTIHYLSIFSLRRITSQAFYRKHVKTANIVVLARECAYYALTIGYTFIRVAKFLFTTIVFVGRIDIPFLAPGIGEIEPLQYKIDSQPYIFMIDIMLHEAHRHPFIEIFGAVCLLKLRHGNAFVTKAGSAWRLLLVSMLMPWLHKYRRLARPTLNSDDDFSTFGLEYVDQPKKNGATSGPRRPEDAIQDLQRENRQLKEQLYLLQRMQTERRSLSSSRAGVAI